MSVLGLIIGLVIIGLLLWVVNTMIPMQQQIKTILNVVVVIVVILWVLSAFGVLPSLSSAKVPHLK